MNRLSITDYKLLDHIRKKQPLARVKITGGKALKETRLELLLSEKLVEDIIPFRYLPQIRGVHQPVPKLEYPTNENVVTISQYQVTDKGMKMLSDWSLVYERERREVHITRALAIAALITSVIALLKP